MHWEKKGITIGKGSFLGYKIAIRLHVCQANVGIQDAFGRLFVQSINRSYLQKYQKDCWNARVRKLVQKWGFAIKLTFSWSVRRLAAPAHQLAMQPSIGAWGPRNAPANVRMIPWTSARGTVNGWITQRSRLSPREEFCVISMKVRTIFFPNFYSIALIYKHCLNLMVPKVSNRFHISLSSC